MSSDKKTSYGLWSGELKNLLICLSC